jgi:hypothetical protein
VIWSNGDLKLFWRLVNTEVGHTFLDTGPEVSFGYLEEYADMLEPVSPPMMVDLSGF